MGCMARVPARVTAAEVDCAGARNAAIETLRDLGYGIAGVYDPMPGRMTVIAAEKETGRAHYRPSVTIRCESGTVEVTPRQPLIARHDPRFDDDFLAAWRERVGKAAPPIPGRIALAPVEAAAPVAGESASSSANNHPMPVVRFDFLSAVETRQQLGADLAAAGLLAVRVNIANRTDRTYLMSAPLVTLQRASGESVPPLGWDTASAHLARSAAGQGWKVYDEVKNALVTDRVLEPDASLDGLLLFPAGEYASARCLLIDQQSAHSERFEAPVPRIASTGGN